MHLCGFHQLPVKPELQVRCANDFGATFGCDVLNAGDAYAYQRDQELAGDVCGKTHSQLIREEAFS
jgi:hypothetical protein